VIKDQQSGHQGHSILDRQAEVTGDSEMSARRYSHSICDSGVSRFRALSIALAALLAAGSFEGRLPADDITPKQIEQLQQALSDARTTRDSLQKSLHRAEEQAKALTTAIEKFKADLVATKSAVGAAEKQLSQHADAVHKFEEAKAQSLVKAATEAKSRQKAAAAALKVVQDKVRANQEAIARLNGQRLKAESQAAESAKSVKTQQDLAQKAKQAAELAAKKAAEADAKLQKTQQSIAAAKTAAAQAATQLKTAETALTATNLDAGKARMALAAVSADAVGKQIAAEKSLIALGRLESFAQKVAPILAQRCLACHDAKTAKGRFNVETFAALMRGGESGAELMPGKSAESNLVNLIEDGTMPQDADPLSKQEIAVIRKWIDTGATLDAGLNPADPLIAIMPSLQQPLPPVAYRVPIPVTAVAFSPDGSQLATSGYHEIIVWNAQDGRRLSRITNVAERVYGIQYSPDGKLIAVAAGTPAQLGEVKLFAATGGDLVADLVRTADAIFAVAFSPDGKRLAVGGADRAIRVFDVATRKQQLLIEDHADWVMDVAWLPDGSKLVSASRDKTAKVFDAKTGDSLVTFNGHGEPVFGVDVAPDGKTIITSGRDKSLRRWNVSDAKEVQRITGFGDEVFRVAVTRDGRIFSCSADRKARVHSLADGKLLKTFAGHADWVYSVAYNDVTKRLATGSFDGEVRIWNAEDGKGLVTFLAAPGYRRPVATAAAK
jgi:WD40 repeat protein